MIISATAYNMLPLEHKSMVMRKKGNRRCAAVAGLAVTPHSGSRLREDKQPSDTGNLSDVVYYYAKNEGLDELQPHRAGTLGALRC